MANSSPPAAALETPATRVGLAGRLRSAASTTPGRMQVISFVLLGCLALSWALGFLAVTQRQQGIQTVRTEGEPVAFRSQTLESLLSRADASAANSFLAGGVEPPAQRARYLSDLAQAQHQFAELAAAGGTSSRVTKSTSTMAESAATYAGLVESARANNRQGFPAGAGYLRRATALLHDTLIPAADTLHTQSLAELDDGYRAASGGFAVTAVLVAAVILLVGLGGAQIFLRRKTRRLFNVGLVTASGLCLLLVGWTLFSLLSEGRKVSSAREQGDTLNLVAQAKVTAFRAKSDESFALIARGSGSAQYEDFDTAVTELGGGEPDQGLIGDAAKGATEPAQRAQLATAAQALKDYLGVHKQIRDLDGTGQSGQAITMALASGPGSSNESFDRLDAALEEVSTQLQSRFDDDISSASRRLSGLAIGTSIGFLIAALLVFYGFQQRIREYR